jgi:serine/threonine-protein kinase
MSPEQAQGRALDARSDVFSLGAVLYELLSGTGPFTGSSIADVLTALLRDDPRPLDAPPALERLISRCLAKTPGHRFQTMAEVRTALEQLAETDADRQPSIAVLPFADMSEARDQEWFSDGLAEEIINALTHIPGLKVTARTSAFAFRGKAQDITAIAAALRVRTILEGSIRRAGNRIRVTAQLINAEDGYHLWSERYDRDLTDIFAIQDDIARAIARALQVQLSETPGAQRQRAANFAAYEAYLKGRHHLYKFTPESLQRGRQHFEQAIALDPTFAPAHSGLGLYYFAMAGQGFMPEDEALTQLRLEAQRALSLDSALPEAHVLLGILASSYNFAWQEAEREFHAAMARQPVDPFARDHYGAFFLMQVGRVEEALAAIDLALLDDPLNLLYRVHRGVCLFAAGRDGEAVSQYLDVLDIDPDNFLAHCWLSAAYAAQQLWPDARRHAERAFALSPSPVVVGWFAGVTFRAGDRARADVLLDRFANSKAVGAAVGLAMFHATNDIDEALVWLAEGIQRHESIVLLPLLFRRFCASSPRWPAVAKMMNLPG